MFVAPTTENQTSKNVKKLQTELKREYFDAMSQLSLSIVLTYRDA